MISLGTSNGWEIQQIDVNNAFLNGDLGEDVFMAQPEGFDDKRYLDHVCKLNKALHGLKKAPRAWFEKLKSTLDSWRFINTKLDSSLFVKKKGKDLTYVLVYVYDVLITGSNEGYVHSLIERLGSFFALKIPGPFHGCLRIKVSRQSNGLHLSQSNYITDILCRTGLQNSKGCKTPMSMGHKLSKAIEDYFENPRLYKSTIEALQYLGMTRLDIAYIMSELNSSWKSSQIVTARPI